MAGEILFTATKLGDDDDWKNAGDVYKGFEECRVEEDLYIVRCNFGKDVVGFLYNAGDTFIFVFSSKNPDYSGLNGWNGRGFVSASEAVAFLQCAYRYC